MPTSTITCIDCGASRAASWKNTKYCKLCRLLRDLTYIGTKTKKCAECAVTFAPVSRSDALCSKCNPFYDEHLRGDCRVCGTADQPLYLPGLAVCWTCIRDPKKRGKVFRGLRLRVSNEKERNHAASQ